MSLTVSTAKLPPILMADLASSAAQPAEGGTRNVSSASGSIIIANFMSISTLAASRNSSARKTTGPALLRGAARIAEVRGLGKSSCTVAHNRDQQVACRYA